MAKRYCHVSEYEKEILELKEQGYTKREIGQKLGFTKKQIHNFITRINRNKRKMAAGVPVRKKGRPASRELNSESDKLSELRYIVARQEAKIKALEIENELMRDFLSLTERK
jgi:IS30 family transposase